jgi:hypothetical protein
MTRAEVSRIDVGLSACQPPSSCAKTPATFGDASELAWQVESQRAARGFLVGERRSVGFAEQPAHVPVVA